MSREVDSVIFDVGGVLARTGRHSDFTSRFPGADPDVVARIMLGDYGADDDHPWHRLERGEISFDEVRRLNKIALEKAGIVMPPAPPEGSREAFSFELNPPVVELVHELRTAGLRLGVLTNNIREFRPMWRSMLDFDDLFDDVVDSHEVGLRKPNPAIYRLALERLGAQAERTVFLDDVTSNVEAAISVGMRAVVVDVDPAEAVATVRRWAGIGG
ncbi:MAG: hypothetical protein RLZ04_777 [Actinomycetota bacterium]